jgi:hypothetical protein
MSLLVKSDYNAAMEVTVNAGILFLTVVVGFIIGAVVPIPRKR